MLTGGRWSGDYLVSPLADWEDQGQKFKDRRHKIRIFRVKEIVFDPDPEKITFPLREAMDKKTRGIDNPRKGVTDGDVEVCEDAGDEGARLLPNQSAMLVETSDAVASEVVQP